MRKGLPARSSGVVMSGAAYGNGPLPCLTAFIVGLRALGVACGVVVLAGCGAAPPVVDSSPGSARPLTAGNPPAGAETTARLPAPLFELPLESLLTRKPPFAGGGRNAFRFGGLAVGERGASAMVALASAVESAGIIPAPVAATRVIPTIEGAPAIRFIGLVEVRARPAPVAVLADGDDVYHGLVNDVVQGRYRILSVGAASVEVEDVARGSRVVLQLSEASGAHR